MKLPEASNQASSSLLFWSFHEGRDSGLVPLPHPQPQNLKSHLVTSVGASLPRWHILFPEDGATVTEKHSAAPALGMTQVSPAAPPLRDLTIAALEELSQQLPATLQRAANRE